MSEGQRPRHRHAYVARSRFLLQERPAVHPEKSADIYNIFPANPWSLVSLLHCHMYRHSIFYHVSGMSTLRRSSKCDTGRIFVFPWSICIRSTASRPPIDLTISLNWRTVEGADPDIKDGVGVFHPRGNIYHLFFVIGVRF